jgi:predicted nucleic acid-binding Zn finger protein
MKRKTRNKVQLTLERKAIRKHVFLPSQSEIWTVIGEEGDNLVNEKPPFCSCKDFYFNILKKKRQLCYHLNAFLIAKKREEYSTFYYRDDEFESFMKILFMDIK